MTTRIVSYELLIVDGHPDRIDYLPLRPGNGWIAVRRSTGEKAPGADQAEARARLFETTGMRECA